MRVLYDANGREIRPKSVLDDIPEGILKQQRKFVGDWITRTMETHRQITFKLYDGDGRPLPWSQTR